VEAAAPDAGADSGGAVVSTLSILGAQLDAAGNKTCLACATTSGCFDPAQQGGTCELLTTTLPHFGTALPDSKTCAAVLGAEPVTEKAICLQTLSTIFTSKCADTLQETPCLCGLTPTAGCLAGTATPAGPTFDLDVCDFNTTSSSTIQADFTVATFGAGMANAIVQCAAAFGCGCFGN